MFLDLNISDFSESGLNVANHEISDFKKRNENLLADLEKYLINDQNTLDASAIEEHLFPSVEADVFISHSHSDEASAIKLAIKLERIGLKVFVDSCVWGHADDLLLKLDKAFCTNNKPGSYDYSLRNRTTSNVHMILNSALHGMIDRSELLIFLSTDNSVKMGDYVANEKKSIITVDFLGTDFCCKSTATSS